MPTTRVTHAQGGTGEMGREEEKEKMEKANLNKERIHGETWDKKRRDEDMG